eukprot:CAMPEP_0179305574 /NCGR_PEP_ID=MMETSP0797-20121207/49684_1 /TAXON_ID=47934 /ORGANISM="Dinophysis acuminata, Strain DAEP01" /LENGTH=42 /DNA_ID= /DNA_START= /DNA_END= /DNA_ORIENTATION=
MQALRSASLFMVAVVVPQVAEGSTWISSKCPGESCFGNPDAP